MDNLNEKEEWVKAIQYLKSYYTQKKFHKIHPLNQKLNQELMLRICSELESRNWPEMISSLNFTSFIRDKQLETVLETSCFEAIQNRVLMARFSKRTFKQQRHPSRKVSKNEMEEDTSVTSESTMLNNLMSGMKASSLYYGFLISQKTINEVNEKYSIVDDEVLDNSSLEKPFKFNIIYLYEYKMEGDETPIKKEIDIKEIHNIQYVFRGNAYTVTFDMSPNKSYCLDFQSALVCLNWLNGIRNAKRTEQEISVSISGILKYNIKIVYELFAKNQIEEMKSISHHIYKNLTEQTDTDVLLQNFKNSVKEVHYFCDAFFSYKPFMKDVFQINFQNIHENIRSIMMDFWNSKYKSLSSGEILTFGKISHEYSTTLHNWGIQDSKFEDVFEAVSKTVCKHLFDSSIDIIFKTINECLFSFRKESGYFINNSIRLLEAHSYICFDNFDQIPRMEMSQWLVKMITMMISIVQTNLIILIEKNSDILEDEVLVSLINCGFDDFIMKLMTKINSKSKISFEELRKMFSYDYLQRNNLKMNEVSFKVLENKIVHEIEQIYNQDKVSFIDHDMQAFCMEFLILYSDILQGFTKHWNCIMLMEKITYKLMEIYVQHFFEFSENISIDNFYQLITKIQQDKIKLTLSFQPFSGEDILIWLFPLSTIINFLKNDSIESIRTNTVALFAYFGELFISETNMESLLAYKVFFSDEQLFLIKKELSNSIKVHKEHGNRNGIKSLKNILNIAPKIQNFIKSFRDKKNNKNKRERGKTQVGSQILKSFKKMMSIEEIFTFETDCLYVALMPNKSFEEVEKSVVSNQK